MDISTEDKIELNQEVAKTYKLAPGAPGIFETRKHGTIDIRTVTPAKVAELIADGCNVFIEKETAAKPVVPAKVNDK
jgi:hypothetical protein